DAQAGRIDKLSDRRELDPVGIDDERHRATLHDYPSIMSSFPVTRLRRFRRTSGLRGLVRETRLSLDDFVMPLFVGPEAYANDELPGLRRHSVDTVVGEADELAALGVNAVILFGIPDEKDDEGSGAYDDDGIVQRALRALRERQPQLALLTDV